MRKNLNRGRKKICLRCLPKIYSFLTENISLTTSKLTQRRLRICFLGSLQLSKSLFFPIITKYIHWLITKLLKIKVIKQENAGHKIYIIYIPLNVNSVLRLNIKYIEKY